MCSAVGSIRYAGRRVTSRQPRHPNQIDKAIAPKDTGDSGPHRDG